MRIYIDLIFLFDFFADYLSLWISSALYIKTPRIRRILASAIGGGYAVSAAFFPVLGNIFIKFLVAVLISSVAFLPRKTHEFIRCSALYIVSSMLLSGGVMLALPKPGVVRIILAVLGVGCIMVAGISLFKSKIYAKYLPCEIRFDGKRVRTAGFYDSGNRLMVAEGLRKVIVVDLRVVRRLISPLVTAENLTEFLPDEKLVKISYQAPNPSEMMAFLPDSVKVNGILYDDVVLAVSETELEMGVVLHSTMC
ncbi:MAG: sigma-E processing peptidase SpoIIGA [Clostridia bacterium]|nr:sigma-E processing peptidase SpoIIGA [Clostridia bacterium]